MKLLILLALLGTACGQDDSSNDETSNDKPLLSISVDLWGDLPECTKANEKQLAYVKEEKQFFVCENDWQPIEVESVAVEGEKGERGDDGADGITVTTNNWFDAVTNKNWLIGASANYASALTSCDLPWRIPTKDEALAAAQRGLGVTASSIGGPTSMWTSDVFSLNAMNNHIIQAINTAPSVSSADRTADSRGVFCVED